MTPTSTIDLRTISVFIDRRPEDVYAFAANPANLPQWASGLGDSIEQVDGGWVAQTGDGPITIRFVEQNTLGVLDHVVTTEAGEELYSPMRVIPYGSGAILLFTLVRGADWSDERFARDAAWVERDLYALKAVLER